MYGQAAFLDGRGQPQAPQHGKCAGIHGVAAQLVAGKRGAIEEPDARAGAGEDCRGHRAGRACADNQDVGMGHIAWMPI